MSFFASPTLVSVLDAEGFGFVAGGDQGSCIRHRADDAERLAAILGV